MRPNRNAMIACTIADCDNEEYRREYKVNARALMEKCRWGDWIIDIGLKFNTLTEWTVHEITIVDDLCRSYIIQMGRVFAMWLMAPYLLPMESDLPCTLAFMERMVTAICQMAEMESTQDVLYEEELDDDVDWLTAETHTLGDIAPLHSCVENAEIAKRWVTLAVSTINCRYQAEPSCGQPDRCVFCASTFGAASFTGVNGKQVAAAVAICLRRARWKETPSLSYLILSLMKEAKSLQYDKAISYYGGVTVPIDEIQEIFNDKQGKQYYVQRRRNLNKVDEYCVVYDATNRHYAGWLHRLAELEEALPKYKGELGINMERWADAVEVFLGTLELAECVESLVTWSCLTRCFVREDGPRLSLSVR